MRAISYCGNCLTGTATDLRSEVVCRKCGDRRAVGEFREPLERCPLCGCGHLYVEKDFPARLGLAIMLAGVAGFVWMTFHDILIALGVLMGVAALDFLAYLLFPWRTICYRCLATYRGVRRNPEHRAYELGIAGRYSDEYEELRSRLK